MCPGPPAALCGSEDAKLKHERVGFCSVRFPSARVFPELHHPKCYPWRSYPSPHGCAEMKERQSAKGVTAPTRLPEVQQVLIHALQKALMCY